MTLTAKSSTEYYGSVKGMPMAQLKERLSKALADVAELSEEKRRRDAFTSTEMLADRLHRLLHFVADCDFYYSDWPIASGCRAEFFALASRLEDWYADEDGRKAGDRPLGQMVAELERARFGSSV